MLGITLSVCRSICPYFFEAQLLDRWIDIDESLHSYSAPLEGGHEGA